MISKHDFDEITATKRRSMAARLKPKFWKSGRRAGKLRTPGGELPFSLAEFRAWAMKAVGLGAVRCHYCPRAIDVLSFEPDHFMPLELGGGAGLDNLVASCEDCNRLKGSMPPQDFIALMKLIEGTLSRAGAADLTKRLRAGAMGIRQRHFPMQPKGTKPTAPAAPMATNREMDFF